MLAWILKISNEASSELSLSEGWNYKYALESAKSILLLKRSEQDTPDCLQDLQETD